MVDWSVVAWHYCLRSRTRREPGPVNKSVLPSAITPTELVNPKVQIDGHLKFNVLVTSTSECTFNMFADKGWEFRGCDLLEKKPATGGSKQ